MEESQEYSLQRRLKEPEGPGSAYIHVGGWPQA